MEYIIQTARLCSYFSAKYRLVQHKP